MLENLETLIALKTHRTMTATGTALRVSQSTISKRITALEEEYGQELVRQNGRYVELTEAGIHLVDKALPLIAELKATLESNVGPSNFSIGVSESILSSWGGAYLKHLYKSFACKEIQLEIHAHRSPVIIDKVFAGSLDLGLCSGKIRTLDSLISEDLGKEEIILATSGSAKSNKNFTIEKTSATWQAIEKHPALASVKIDGRLESFFSLGQMAKSGIHNSLIPIGVAEALTIEKRNVKSFRPKIFRPLQIVYRKSKLQIEDFSFLLKKMTCPQISKRIP